MQLFYYFGMAARFVNIDYDTPLILPPHLRDWVPAGQLAHFILDAVEEMDLRQIKVNDRGTGSEQDPSRMLLALLLYCYATGLFSSRRIEQATQDRVPVRLICGDIRLAGRRNTVHGIGSTRRRTGGQNHPAPGSTKAPDSGSLDPGSTNGTRI